MTAKREGRPIFRVLVVDDNKTTLDVLRLVMGNVPQYELQVTAAPGGKEALRALEGGSFDLALFDAMMPDMDGFDLLRQVVPRHPGMPVVTMTAYAGSFSRKRAMDLGAFDFLEKPFRVKDLTVLVERVLATRGPGRG
ncbi:MAG: response regulator [Planctomycetes bacterium]|nr:response regulator [Planctomycetota bacterium]